MILLFPVLLSQRSLCDPFPWIWAECVMTSTSRGQQRWHHILSNRGHNFCLFLQPCCEEALATLGSHLQVLAYAAVRSQQGVSMSLHIGVRKSTRRLRCHMGNPEPELLRWAQSSLRTMRENYSTKWLFFFFMPLKFQWFVTQKYKIGLKKVTDDSTFSSSLLYYL